jgi:hypothetical protein
MAENRPHHPANMEDDLLRGTQANVSGVHGRIEERAWYGGKSVHT